jgi:hypothetical protein
MTIDFLLNGPTLASCQAGMHTKNAKLYFAGMKRRQRIQATKQPRALSLIECALDAGTWAEQRLRSLRLTN